MTERILSTEPLVIGQNDAITCRRSGIAFRCYLESRKYYDPEDPVAEKMEARGEVSFDEDENVYVGYQEKDIGIIDKLELKGNSVDISAGFDWLDIKSGYDIGLDQNSVRISTRHKPVDCKIINKNVSGTARSSGGGWSEPWSHDTKDLQCNI